MVSLQDIKDRYYYELAILNKERMSLNQYIKAHYISVYELRSGKLIGYERKSLHFLYTK